MYFVGIDIGKRHHDASVMDEQGEGRLHLTFANTSAGLERLLERLAKLAPLGPAHFRFALESTAHYWMGTHHALEARGFSVAVVNPLRSSAARNLYLRKAKTNLRDSFLIADLLRMNRVGESQVPSEETLRLQQLSRLRFSLVDSLTSLKLRTIALLDRIFPEYEGCFPDVFCDASTALLRRYPTPGHIARARLSTLVELLRKQSRGQIGQPTAEALQAHARTSLGTTLALDTLVFELHLLLAQVEFDKQQIKQISDAIARIMKERKPVIMTIPGIGPVLGAAILGEIGDVSRFRGPKKLVAFAGLDATVCQSGQYESTRRRLSKRGSPRLRRAIWLAAVNAIRRDTQLGKMYHTQLARGKHALVAVGAVARKLTHLIYYLCLHNRPYDPGYWEQSQLAPPPEYAVA